MRNLSNMAKKDPTDLPVEKKLETLFELQSTLSQIDEKRALRGELPLEVQDLEDEITGLRTRIEKIENEISEFQNAITRERVISPRLRPVWQDTMSNSTR